MRMKFNYKCKEIDASNFLPKRFIKKLDDVVKKFYNQSYTVDVREIIFDFILEAVTMDYVIFTTNDDNSITQYLGEVYLEMSESEDFNLGLFCASLDNINIDKEDNNEQ